MGISHKSIAYDSIMQRRNNTVVPCSPGGTLLDYVAFYFCPRSPMLYTISRDNVAGLSGSQESIISIVSSTQDIQSAGLDFVFTDGHGIMTFTKFFNNLSDLNQVDWELMKSRYWNDTIDEPDRKRRRQAEFLVFERFPLNHANAIAVKTQRMKRQVDSLLKKLNCSIAVYVRPNWYY
jgi:hypothetical protein